MDRASDSGSEGWGFESLPVYHEKATVLIETVAFSAIFAFGELNLLCKLNWLAPAKLPAGS